ncbi:hypothetical protein CANARDRAFT_8752 [[Candida] arabinofermentans NRRL YB-2248]|uniref:Cation/H+ exchanger domain-containing protein n=1 Tax=[Candida] arabinofermentans NRRL YB-2248 TaxID=983967 RepID=A0A1E4SY23_9ASCO|nr:hypothetical protein CANARDRAFT_8752 [[Candida] arabinofermentans NRRL YB-2248]
MVWSHLNPDKAHVAYAVIAVFSAMFSLCSLFVKEKLYIGEATVASIFGLIVGPHCLNWFDPETWGNELYITLEISRVLLCIEIIAVAVELPKKYIWKHWKGVFLLLIPVMTTGWLVIGLFIWAIIPGLNFGHGLLISACITATDPVLAQAVVGKGKFAKRVPAHLRNLLSAESACNDGVSVPFVYLSLNIIVHAGNAGEIAKDWITVTVLYECLFGCILGATLGFLGRKAIRFAEEKDLIDRESFLAFYILLALLCAGFGSILGVDDLLASFAAGAAFSWDGWFTERTEETHVSTVIDLLLNLAYFVYFGSIIPWADFNNKDLGLDWWRLVCLGLVVLVLRRIPAVLAIKPFNPDIKNWKEALFVGHFGPIGVGAVFAAIIAIGDLEADVLGIEHGPTDAYTTEHEYYQLIRIIWPVVTFLILTSIIVHGSSVAVLTLGRHLQTMTFTMTLTRVETEGGGWTSRLPKLEKSSTSFSIKRIDTMAPSEMSNNNNNNNLLGGDEVGSRISRSTTFEENTAQHGSGHTVRPAGGMKRRKKKRRLQRQIKEKGRKVPPVSETLDLRKNNNISTDDELEDRKEQVEEQEEGGGGHAMESTVVAEGSSTSQEEHSGNVTQLPTIEIRTREGDDMDDVPLVRVRSSDEAMEKLQEVYHIDESTLQPKLDDDGELRIPAYGYDDGSQLIIEDQHGEVLHTVQSKISARSEENKSEDEKESVHSLSSLKKKINFFAEKAHHQSNDDEYQYKAAVQPEESINSLVNKATPARKLFLGSRSKKPSKKTDSDAPQSQRFHGYRIDDNIIIENDEGEIVGRYKVNQKTEQSSSNAPAAPGMSRERSNTFGQRALRMMGLGRSSAASSSAGVGEASNQGGGLYSHNEDGSVGSLGPYDAEKNQRGNDDLIPDPDDESEMNLTNEAKFQRKLRGFLNADSRMVLVSSNDSKKVDVKKKQPTGSSGRASHQKKRKQLGVKRQLTGLPQNDSPGLADRKHFDTDSEEEEEDSEIDDGVNHSDIDSDSNDDDDDDYMANDQSTGARMLQGESEYEMARRLAALNVEANTNRDSDDEESEPITKY